LHPDWLRSLRYQCQYHGVAFFFKQWGDWEPRHDGIKESQSPIMWPDGYYGAGHADYHDGFGTSFVKSGKKIAGRKLDGQEWNEFPQGKHP